MSNGPNPASKAGPERRRDLDLMRALVVVGLIFFHSALIFDPRDDYYVKNATTSDLVTVGTALAVVWAMPLLFVIAGTGTWFSLRSRTAGRFVAERVRRLLVPLVFATVTIIPLPVWFRLRGDPGYRESYWPFLRRFLSVDLDWGEFPFILRPAYEDAGFETGHLWFVLLLLVFAVILLPVFLWLRQPQGRRAMERLATAASRRGAVLLPAVPMAALSFVLDFEEGLAVWNRWAYALFFVYGFVLASDPRFWRAVRAGATAGLVSFIFLFAGSAVLFGLYGDTPGVDLFVGYEPASLGFRFLFGLAGWPALVAILGLAARIDRPASSERIPAGTDRMSRLSGYANQAVLPMYILHQPVIVAIAFYVVRWELPATVKYGIISLASLAVVLIIYDLAIRRTALTRFLFGMKGPRRVGGPAVPPAEAPATAPGAVLRR